MSDFETIAMERDGAVMRVSFNRPDNLNSFNVKMRREFVEAARLVNVDDSVRVVTLTGAGRAFSAGADLTDDEGLSGGQGVEDDLNFEYKPGILAIHNSRKPWVAVVNGPCAGIGYWSLEVAYRPSHSGFCFFRNEITAFFASALSIQNFCNAASLAIDSSSE